MQPSTYALVIAATMQASLVGLAVAQTTQPTVDAGVPAAGQRSTPTDATQDKPVYSISAGSAYQFDTDLEDAGSFSLTRYGVGAGVHYPISGTNLSLDHSLVYERDDYNFSTVEPWGDTNLVSYSANVNCRIDQQWAVFAGPVLGFSAEDGANWGDAFSYGASAGVRYQASKDFSIGLGIIGVQEIEHDFTVVPLVLVNWKISDQLRLGNARPQPGLRGGAGLELVWTFAPQWETAVGGSYDRRRFRLNDTEHTIVDGDRAVAYNGDGIGQNQSVPLYARVTYHPNGHWSISGLGGMLVGGQLRLEDSSGHKLAEQDYDVAPFVGAAISWRM